ncbi:hypothetical protein HOLleu_38474 [Holothuria leucospilota]|uniref:Uncharacterized protein n=1 Tax=Holothuria leucospilota TaxID=206669 RepID=A0A9Q0YF67_HOLLE|nr:hypothetical protein HOLleu_38474 [Holothuria leucospilota]
MAHLCKELLTALIMSSVALGLERKTIPNLRQFSTKGWGGEFKANKDVLEKEIRGRFMQDPVSGKGKCESTDIYVFRGLHADSFSEVAIFYESHIDHTILPDSLKDEVATNFRQLSVMVQIATNTHLQLVRFTDSTNLVLNSFATNYDTVNYIDRIEDDEEGQVKLFKGEDFMYLEIEEDPGCDEEDSEKLKEEFKYLEFPQYKTTNYPLPFDWGCDLLGDEVGFCEDLRKYNCELQKVGSDICNLIETSYISIGRASMRITNMTGYFRDSVPFLAPFQFPIESLDAESTDLNHTVGLIYPCLTGI